MKKPTILLIAIGMIVMIMQSCEPLAEQKSEIKLTEEQIQQNAYLDSAVILWTLSKSDLENHIGQKLIPVEIPRGNNDRFLVKYLSFNDVGFDSLHIYEPDTVKKILCDQKIVAVIGNYMNLVQEKKSAGKDINIANLMFIGTPVKLDDGTERLSGKPKSW